MQLPIISTSLLAFFFTVAQGALIRNEAEIRKQSPIFAHPVMFENPVPVPVTKTEILTKWHTRVVLDTQTATTTVETAAPTVQEVRPPLVRVAYKTEDPAQKARGEKACGTCDKCRNFYDCKYSDKECQKACDISRSCIECRMWINARMSDSYGFDIDIDYPMDWEVSMDIGSNGVIELRSSSSESDA